MNHARLPVGFTELEEFVDQWAYATEGQRLAKRIDSDLAQLERFYAVAIAAAPRALDLLSMFPANTILPGPEARLSELMLMLAEVAPAVELFGAPVEFGVFDPRRMEIVHEPGS